MHSAHGKTPYEVFYGRKPRGAFVYNETLIGAHVEVDEPSPAEPTAAAIESQQKDISKIWQAANEKLDKYRARKVRNLIMMHFLRYNRPRFLN
jgi:hypothetical protein